MNDIDFDELDRAVEELMVKRKAGKSARAAVNAANKSATTLAVNSAIAKDIDSAETIIHQPVEPVSTGFKLEVKDDPTPRDQFNIEPKGKDLMDKLGSEKSISHPLEVKITPTEEIEDYLKTSRDRQENSLVTVKDVTQNSPVESKIDSKLDDKINNSLFESHSRLRLEPTENLDANPVADEVKSEPPLPEIEMSASDQLINSFDSEELDAKFIDQIDDDELEEQDFDFLEEDDQVGLVNQLDVDQSTRKPINDSVKNELLPKTKSSVKSAARGRFMDIVNPDLATGSASSVARESVDRLTKAKRFAASMNRRTTTKISDFAPRVKSETEIFNIAAKPETNTPLERTEPKALTKTAADTDDTDDTVLVNLNSQPQISDLALGIQIPDVVEEVISEEIIIVKDDFPSEDDSSEADLSETEFANDDVTDQELDDVLAGRRSPFIPKAMVNKRPLGSPEQFHLVPNVTMHVPDRILQPASEGSTALYRAELHQPEDRKAKTSGLGLIIIIIIFLLVAGLLIYFADDISARLL